MDSSRAPNMTLSIGGFGLNTDILHGDAAMAIKPSQGIAQNPCWDVCNNSPGLKRKRGKSNTLPRTEISSLSFENDGASRPSLGLCNAGLSTGSKTCTGTMFMQGIASEGPAMSLGLGLTGPSSHSLENGRVTSFISGGRSVLTSADMSTRQSANMNSEPGNGASVLLGLGPSHCHSISIKSTGGARKSFKAANANLFGSDLGVQLQLGLSRSSAGASDDDRISSMSLDQGNGVVFHDTGGGICNELNLVVDDEGSTSARTLKAGGYMPSLVMGRRLDGALCFETETEAQHSQGERDLVHQACNGELGSSFTYKERRLDDLFMNLKTSSLTTSTSGPSAIADRTPKTCKFRGCGKGARGASGLCITHGGGRRCQRQGCNKGAEGRTVYCKSHGGGRRCQSLGCTKSAEGKTDYCIGHGGGRRCSSQDGCSKAARGRSGLCIRHGGGKRCQKEGCTKSAEGYSGLCISHGGGRRCQAEGCGKGAQGSTLFCKAHGGGKRCMIQGCTKGAEGSTPLCKGHGGGKRCMFDGGGICTKSVHGGTSFCVAHGGGKRCAMEGCTKSARGRTSFCVRHGGGKRCKFENCTKSAQGSTEFCKAHGGGKRCSWGQEGSPYSEFLKDKSGELFKGPCDRFARGKIGLCAAHSALVQDRRVHGAGTIGSALPAGIGPGLFRGLVTGVTPKGNQVESASNASKQSAHGSEEQGEHGSESGGSDSIQKGGANSRPPEGESACMEDVSCHARGLPSLSLGYNPVTRNNFNVFQTETPSLNKMSGGVLISHNGTTCLWPGISSRSESKGNHMIGKGVRNFFTPGLLSASNSVEVLALGNQPVGEGTVFRRSLLPPQVLVPLSMQKGEFLPSHGKGSVKHTRISNAGHNGIINTSVHEERVHGGSACKERVHGGSVHKERVYGGSAHEPRVHEGSVHEKRVHGGGMLALLSESNYQKNS